MKGNNSIICIICGIAVHIGQPTKAGWLCAACSLRNEREKDGVLSSETEARRRKREKKQAK